MLKLSRREVLKVTGIAATGACLPSLIPASTKPPVAPVALGRCRTYGKEVGAALDDLFNKLGGPKSMVSGKTVAVKVNLTGGLRPIPGGRSAGQTYHVHPSIVLACCQALGNAGARRLRLIEGWDPALPAEKFLGHCGWNLRAMRAAANVEFENTNNRGAAKNYVHVKVRHGGFVSPSFELNHSYVDADFFVSLAKMKNHYTAGVTLALKNYFGIAPTSFYGDDAGNEAAKIPRMNIFHRGSQQPPALAAPEINRKSSRDDGYRVPRITIDLVNAVAPINLSIIDGVQTVQGGEGPWIKPLRLADPGLLVVGLNPVCTDAVCTAVMGYDRAGGWTSPPFYHGDNHIKLAESAGLGSADLKQIEVRGLSIDKALFRFEPGGKNG